MSDKKKLTSICRRLLFAALFSATACGGGQSESIDLAGTWKFIPADRPEASKSAFDDRSYRDITLPGHWFSHLNNSPNLNSTVWLRKKITIDDRLKGKSLALITGRIGIADEAWLLSLIHI